MPRTTVGSLVNGREFNNASPSSKIRGVKIVIVRLYPTKPINITMKSGSILNKLDSVRVLIDNQRTLRIKKCQRAGKPVTNCFVETFQIAGTAAFFPPSNLLDRNAKQADLFAFHFQGNITQKSRQDTQKHEGYYQSNNDYCYHKVG